MGRQRWLTVIIGAIFIIAVLFLAFRETSIPVDTAVVTVGDVEVTIREEGRTRLQNRYQIAAPVSGHLQRIDLEVGDRVAAGGTVAVLHPTLPTPLDARSRARAEATLLAAGAAIESRQGECDAAAADTELARLQLERAELLFSTEDATIAEVDSAKARYSQAQARQQSATAAVEVARYEEANARATLEATRSYGDSELATLELCSPVAGQVLFRARESEGTVNAGEVILEIGNSQQIEVEVDVLSEDAVRLREGMRVHFERWGGERELEGSVRTIEPQGFTKISALGVEEQRVWVICDLTTPVVERARLGDGYRVEARFVLDEAHDTPCIPTSALFRIDDGWGVFQVEDDVLAIREVEIGLRSGLVSSVRSGLQVGDIVVTHPGDRLHAGVSVSRRGAAAKN